ncbi:MAG: ribosome maturation factor RimP [Pseudonocardiaceae bacterium]|nr:ribosome maturation factor RimP [Pseudonocardiaceae bacterium]
MTAQSANGDSPLEPVVRDAVAHAGFELEHLDVVRSGKRKLLRVVVDSSSDTDGVGLDDITTVSRAVSAVLDEHDELLGGPYTLEVTSPGVDRPLTRPRHWRRNRLRLVRVRRVDGDEFVGRIGDCDAEGVTLLADGALQRVRYVEMERAAVELEFNQPPATELAALDAPQSGTEEQR